MAVTETQVAEIYAATFNRASSTESFDYWVEDSGLTTIEQVASSFFDQEEAQEIYTDNGTDISTEEFINRIYENLFNRAPAESGLEYWSEELDSGSISKAEMILAVVNGTSPGNDDALTLAHKTAACLYYAEKNAEETDMDPDLSDIDETPESLAAFKAAVDAAVGERIFTADTDNFTGSAENDSFEAPIVQNPWAGGVSNSLSTADTLDGGAGTEDSFYAELVPEFYGVTGDNTMDVQPNIQSVEYIEFEAMDVSASVNAGVTVITVDAKNITDVDHIGSTYSDGDLIIENLTTLTAAGTIRNTEEITITMDHTDSFDSDGDASDLVVLFDEDYLVSGQTSESSARYWLLDEEAEELGLAERLHHINVDGISFMLDGDPIQYDIRGTNVYDPDPSIPAGTHESFFFALEEALDQGIADGSLPDNLTLTLEYSDLYPQHAYTYLDDSSRSDLIPAIVLATTDGTAVTPLGFYQIESEIDDYDVYGEFDSESETENDPIAVNVELEKVGRDGEGGNLIVGGKDLGLNTDTDEDQADGITRINVAVNGDNDQPSNLGNISSTNQALETIYIANGDTWDGAELTIRDGIGIANAVTDGINYNNGTEYELTLINATAFSGDFSLAMSAYTSQQALTSQFGSGNDSYDWMSVESDGVSSDKDYLISMGSGDDTVTATLDGDSVDALGESFTLEAGAGDDTITLDRNDGIDDGVSQTTMRLLDNIDIDLGSGDDLLDMDNNFNADIDAGAGNDIVYMNASNANGNGIAGNIPIGNSTGVQNFGERVLYNAELTISFAGFEATVDIDTKSASDFIADQTTINDAVMEAIDNDPVLSELLTYSLDDGTQQLTITAGFDGANSIGIAIYQPTLVTANAGDGQVVLSNGDLSAVEAGFIATNNLHNTTNTLVNTLDSDDFVDVATAVAAINNLNWAGAVNELGVGDNAIYTEIETDVELTRGAQTTDILDAAVDNYLDYAAIGTDSTSGFNLSTINMGTGANDIVVMHSNDNSAGVLEIDAAFGKVSVVNWQDNPTHTITQANQMGFNAMDFTAYLDNQVDPSATSNTNSAVDVAVTTNIVAGCEAVAGLSAGVNNTNTAVANSVNVIRFIEDAANSQTFENLTASTLVASLNNGGTAYGNINDNTLDAAISAGGIVIGGTANHIIMVENSTNEGEYKVFYVESDDDTTTNANGDFNESGALELGIVDFGASVNLLQVGSVAYESLIENFTLAIDANDSSFTYDANGDGTESPSEGYTLIDDGGTTTGTAPVAEDDDAEFTVVQGQSVVINVADLLDNDKDDDDDALTIISVSDSGTNDGTAVLSADGQTITFTADADFEGTATFTYTLFDGTFTDNATVTGQVNPDGGGTDITEVAFTNVSSEDAGDDSYQYNINLGDTDIFSGNIANFGDDDVININDAYLGTDNLLFATTGTSEINFAFGDMTDYTPSFTINMTGLDATLVSDVEAAADAVAVMGILDAAWGDDWLI